MTAARFNVLIIGSGAIGAAYDTPGSTEVLTHAHGFSAHPGFRLLGFADTDQSRAEGAARLWGGRAFPSIEEAFREERVDVACVAVPDGAHYAVLKEICDFPLKAVFTEKPLTTQLHQAREIVSLYRDRSLPVSVNYRRSFVPEFEDLRDRIRRGDLGRFLTGTGYYGKGFLHNGSHLIHLLRQLLGEVEDHETVASANDFSEDDPSVSARIFFGGKGVFNLHHVDCGHYTIFELDLLFDKGRARITETGLRIEYHTVAGDPMFKGYRFLTKSEEINTQLGRSLYLAATNLYDHVTLGDPLKCSARDALETMALCERLRPGAAAAEA